MDEKKKSAKKEKPPKKDPKKKPFEQVINGRRFKDHPLGVLIGTARSTAREGG